MWGSTKVFDKATMVLVDHQLLAKFPAISEDPNQRTKRGRTSLRPIHYSAFKPNNPITIFFFAKNETVSYNKMQQVTHIDNEVERL